ncbi:MAG: hypothetical protein CL808_06935 [Citromicrobium sp.]|mgnify:CR=1 FL=1|nr:hypothetical protein [Citromicrobium sp.]
MKSYEMIQANGEKIAVSSTAEARQVMAGFEPFADRFLAEVDTVTSVDAESFAFLQRVADRWNRNHRIFEKIEAEGALAEKKAAETERARTMKEMARKCREASNGSGGQ